MSHPHDLILRYCDNILLLVNLFARSTRVSAQTQETSMKPATEEMKTLTPEEMQLVSGGINFATFPLVVLGVGLALVSLFRVFAPRP